jgi:hypothetical protein
LECSKHVFSRKGEERAFCRSALVAGTALIVAQVVGYFIGYDPSARGSVQQFVVSSVFSRENGYQFINLLILFCAGFTFLTDKSKFWKGYAVAQGALVLASMAYGDTALSGAFKITDQDAVMIWLGAFVGVLFGGLLLACKKLRVPQAAGLVVAAVLVAVIAVFPIVCIHLSFWNSDMPTSLVYRLAYWESAWSVALAHPGGVGFGALSAHINLLAHWTSSLVPHFFVPTVAAHNQGMDTLAEMGWIFWVYFFVLWAVPWCLAVRRYLQTGKWTFLAMASAMASLLAIMETGEETKLFFFCALAEWVFLCLCVRHLLRKEQMKSFRLHPLFFVLAFALAAFLAHDRALQIKGLVELGPIESTGLVTPETLPNLNQSLRTYSKNSPMLYHLSVAQRLQGNFEKSFEAIDDLQTISGNLFPVYLLRAETWLAQGDTAAACKHKRLLSHEWKREQAVFVACKNFGP